MLGPANPWVTPRNHYGGMFCFYVVLDLNLWSSPTAIVLDSVLMLFTPETPKANTQPALPLINNGYQTVMSQSCC